MNLPEYDDTLPERPRETVILGRQLPDAQSPCAVDGAMVIADPAECDICRRDLQKGDAFYRVTLGMDEAPSYVGARLDREPTVEEVSELVVCERCHPLVEAPLSKLLAALWELRKPDAATDDPGGPEVDREAETERSVR